MRKRNKYVILILIICAIALIRYFNRDIWDVNSELLKNQVLSIEETVEVINLLDLTPFEWDVAYSFSPYTSKEVVYEVVGYKWDNISEMLNEALQQIVFVKNGKVICYIHGFTTKSGFALHFKTPYYKDGKRIGANMINIEDDLDFKVRRNNIIHLEQIEE